MGCCYSYILVLCSDRSSESSTGCLSCTGLCPKGTDSLIECQSFKCPGGTYSCHDFRCECQISSPNRDPCTCLGMYMYVRAGVDKERVLHVIKLRVSET